MANECRVTAEMNTSALIKLLEYLKFHEDDIAYCIDDFGDLTGVFTCLFNREPRKDTDDPVEVTAS